jgi:hypothetical protein
MFASNVHNEGPQRNQVFITVDPALLGSWGGSIPGSAVFLDEICCILLHLKAQVPEYDLLFQN